MSEAFQYQVRVLTEEDKDKVMKLLGDTFKMSDEFLAWKYDSNPDFDQSLVVVAVNCGQVVGCMNWLTRSLKISKSLSVKAALGADLAVHENHRGQGLAKPLIASENAILKDKNIVMSYGFIDPRLVEHLHGPLLGLVEVPTSTTVYKKYLNLSEIREKVERMNKIAKSNEEIKRKVANLDMSVLFHLRGMPPFIIQIRQGVVTIEKDDVTGSDVKIICDLTPLALARSRNMILTLITALLMRKIKISGSLTKIIRLSTAFNLLRSLFVRP